MASFLDKLKIKTAVEDRTKLDLGSDHITTAGWMQYNVAYSKEMVPREKLDVRMETFTRLAPLSRPTFGRANINNRAFFVPYRTLWEGWNDFITDAPHTPYTNTGNSPVAPVVGIMSKVPVIKNADILDTLYAFSSTGSGTTDFAIGTSDVNNVLTNNAQNGPRNFTDAGKQAYKILLSLGYNVSFDRSFDAEYSALPLLAVGKIYADWYFPGAYESAAALGWLKTMLKVSVNSSVVYDSAALVNLFNLITFVCYDSDYFTAAWDNPVGPNGTLSSDPNFSAIIIDDVSLYSLTNANKSHIETTNGGTPAITRSDSSGASLGRISQFVIDALKSVTDYMKRHQLVGAKAVDRYLARFGVELDSAKIDRSLYLGSNKVPVQIGDVTAQGWGSGSGEVLGQYAGKGIGYNDGHFDFDTEEYGQFIIISTIIPAVGYYEGVDRNVMHVSKLDYWTPEFDNLGTQAIAKSEVFLNTNGAAPTGQQGMQNGIFGFTPRYAEYKVGHDRLTGDFRLASSSFGEDSWYLLRKLDGKWSTQSQVVQSLDFIRSGDRYEYNRIFNGGNTSATGPHEDMFRIIYHFEIASYAPMKPIFESYEFDSKGKEVVEDVNGIKMN